MSKTMAVHVRYKSLYISLSSSAKQQREMTKFCVICRRRTMTAKLRLMFEFFFSFVFSFVKVLTVINKVHNLRVPRD